MTIIFAFRQYVDSDAAVGKERLAHAETRLSTTNHIHDTYRTLVLLTPAKYDLTQGV